METIKCSATLATVPYDDVEVSGIVDWSGVHDDPAHSLDILLGCTPANGQAKVRPGRCDASELLTRATSSLAPLTFMCGMT